MKIRPNHLLRLAAYLFLGVVVLYVIWDAFEWRGRIVIQILFLICVSYTFISNPKEMPIGRRKPQTAADAAEKQYG